jgi:hypothetical protein
VVTDASPSTKATLGSNTAHLTARFDERTGTVMAICAIDNIAKGASGGAVQAANVALGLPRRPASQRGGDVPVRSPAADKAAMLVEALPYIRASPARSWSSSTAATRSPAPAKAMRSRCSPRTSC